MNTLHCELEYLRIVVAILKMETGRNCSMLGIHSEHHNLPTYEISLNSNNVEFVRYYCGGHFENGDRWKFFDVRNQFVTSLSTDIMFRCRKSIQDVIIYLHVKFR